MKQKDLGISTVRILAMVGIIVCHTVMYYQFIPQHENLGQLFNCGVGIFIFISGLLYGANIRKSFGLDFFKKRWLRVCLPVVIWGTFVFLLDGCRNFCYWIVLLLNLQGINFIVENPIFNTAITGTGPLWFVTVIMLCYLMLPLLEKIRSNWSIGRIKAFVLGSWVVQVFAGLGGGTARLLLYFHTRIFLVAAISKLQKKNKQKQREKYIADTDYGDSHWLKNYQSALC